MADLCADEIMRAVRALWARLPVPVATTDVAERVGASVQSVGQRMARLARAGRLARVGALYAPVEVPRG